MMHYETLTLLQRIGIIKYLADKVLPKMSLQHTTIDDKRVKDPHSWEATIAQAAGKADD